jgi:hypothetical protein
MIDKTRKIPTYPLHKPTGHAVVVDGRDPYLGKHGSEASRENYRLSPVRSCSRLRLSLDSISEKQVVDLEGSDL